MNKLIIDGIDYTENKRKIYGLKKQDIIDDYIKLIVKNGKTEQENQQLKEELNTCMIERNKLVDVIEKISQILNKHRFKENDDYYDYSEQGIRITDWDDDYDELNDLLQKYKGDNK